MRTWGGRFTGETDERVADYTRSIEVDAALDAKPFRFPVQWVNRANQDFRGFCGTVVSGSIRPNDRIVTIDDYNQFGSAQLLWKLDGGYFCASDPRRDGQAAGF